MAGRQPFIAGNPARALSGLVRSGNRPANVVAFDDSVVSFFVDAADMLGVPKSVAAIYGICFASPTPLSFSEIDEKLDISSGSISQGLRVLREVGALKLAEQEKPYRAKGGMSQLRNAENPKSDSALTNSAPRRAGATPSKEDSGDESISISRDFAVAALQRAAARYEPDLELRKLVLHWIEKRLQAQLTSGSHRLEQIVRAMPPASAKSLESLQTRFESLLTWHQKAHSLLPIAKTFLKLT